MKHTKKSRNGKVFNQGDFDWIKRLQNLKVDKNGAARATGWSLDTVNRVFKAESFEAYRESVTTRAKEVTPIALTLPLEEPGTDMEQVITLLQSINHSLGVLVKQTAEQKRGWLR